MFDADSCEFLTVSGLLKAFPSEEGADRILNFEASNEALDQQNEVVLAEALAVSAEFYKKFGNVDIDHVTQVGARMGIPNYNLFEIGRPVDVRIDGRKTFVKAIIYRGEGPVAEKANQVWDSLTKLSPPARWYPSVGGAVLEKGSDFDPATKSARTVIRRVRWSNVGLSRTPVNATVPNVSVGTFAKCWGVGGLDLTKALEAGYGTDSAALAGGSALRGQSLDHRVQSYWGFRDRMAGDIKRGRSKSSAAGIVAHATEHYGLDANEAAEYTERFLGDVKDFFSKGKK